MFLSILLSWCPYCKVNRSYNYRSLVRVISESTAPGRENTRIRWLCRATLLIVPEKLFSFGCRFWQVYWEFQIRSVLKPISFCVRMNQNVKMEYISEECNNVRSTALSHWRGVPAPFLHPADRKCYAISQTSGPKHIWVLEMSTPIRVEQRKRHLLLRFDILKVSVALSWMVYHHKHVLSMS